MSKVAAVIILGFVVAFLPFTGFPNDVKTICATLAGLLIMALGFLVRQERIWLMRMAKGTHKTDAYTESGASYVAAQSTE